MKKTLLQLGICFVALVASAVAQTVTSSGTTGTINNIPYISGATGTSTTFSPSPISISSGNLTIGTGSPFQLNSSNGNVLLQATSTCSSPCSPVTNYSSPTLVLQGNYWNSTASAADTWTVQNVLGSGANPSSTLTFTHSGSSANPQVSLGGIQFDSSGYYGSYLHGAPNTALLLQDGRSFNDAVTGVSVLPSSTITNSSGTFVGLGITPVYQQSGSAGATDLLVNRTETSLGTGNQRLLDLQKSGTSQFWVDHTGNVYAGGNVGIGTSAPNALLQLWTPQSSTPPALLDLRVNNYAEWAFAAAAGNNLTLYPTGGAGNLYLNYGPSSTGITLESNGTVGIGTASPGTTYKLDVEGGEVNSSGGYCINGTNCITSWPTGVVNTANTWSSSQTFNANAYFSGNVGIGTTGGLSWPLQVAGSIVAGIPGTQTGAVGIMPGGPGSWFWIDNPAASGNYLRISNGSSPGGSGASGSVVINGSGNVGIGTTNTNGHMLMVRDAPTNGTDWTLEVNNPINVEGSAAPAEGIKLSLSTEESGGNESNKWDGLLAYTEPGFDYGNEMGLAFYTNQGAGSDQAPTEKMRITAVGNVGIGTTGPSQPLEVNGNAQVDGSLIGSGGGAVAVGSGGIIFPAQNGQPAQTQTTAWTGVLCGGDYAEDMRADQKKESYEPGDVLILTSDDSSDVRKSAEPYSTMVAGIYATKPGVVGLRDAVADSKDNIPMAMVGVVPTKVTAENGPIHKGDLLVTSSTKGYAMKGTDRSQMLGAVLGKAMGSLDSGTGVIEVLVTLQ